MKFCILGSEEDKKAISDSMLKVAELDFENTELDLYSEYENLVYKGPKKEYDTIFVAVDNAAGMEGVIASKKIFPATPVIWFSNDNDFGTQSYRLGVAYFHTKPITAKVIEKALQKAFS